MDLDFLKSESRLLVPHPTVLVIFGGTGDLASKKLLPSLFDLFEKELLPENFRILGTGRGELSCQEYRNQMSAALKQSGVEPGSKQLSAFLNAVSYFAVDSNNLNTFKALSLKLKELDKSNETLYNWVFYLATAPGHFGSIANNLHKAGLGKDVYERRIALVVEKPFGTDLESAKALNSSLLECFREEQIYRIDHYLGKETVQNILVFRFANGIFEPLWNRHFIDHIQITMAEDIGVGQRADYFEKAGILRDIVQNHLLQILSLLCIEPPISLSDPDSIRDEKTKVLKCVKSFTPGEAEQNSIRAQYLDGFIGGKSVVGYLDEDGVSKASKTDTYVALKLEIDNWRWGGVPIYIRAGKRLPKRITEITVYFRAAPLHLFKGRQVNTIEQNVLAIQVQPEEGISLKVSTKAPGPRLRIQPVEMDFSYGSAFGTPSPQAYERLLLDVLRGDPTLFTRKDEIEEAWRIVEPFLELWSDKAGPALHTYSSGTWGPKEAADLLKRAGHRWRRL